MREIKIRIVAEIACPWGNVTVDLKQAHPVAGGSVRHGLDRALDASVEQVRDMYRTSGRTVRRG